MTDTVTDSPPEWISAHDTLELVSARNRDPDAAFTIAKRAHSGLVRARARVFVREQDAGRGAKEKFCEEAAELPCEFWWAEGHESLEQNWASGDFSTWIERTYQWQAFGVQFRRDDIDDMLRAEITAPNCAPFIKENDPDQTHPPRMPSDDEIRAKMIDLHEKGVARDVAAKIIRDFPGFEQVGNEHARRVAAGNLVRGRPKKSA